MIEKELFKKLVIEMIDSKKYENIISSKYNSKDYKKFINFFEKIENFAEIDLNNFEKIFIAYYRFKTNTTRINFATHIKKEIAEKSAYCCAMRHCRMYTKEYDMKDMKKPSGSGQAAHIYSASKSNKIRQSLEINKIEIDSVKNGLWLCANCHPYVDYIEASDLYSVNMLLAYKQQIEDEVNFFLSKKNKLYENLTYLEKNELKDKIQSNKIDIIFNNLYKKEAKIYLSLNAINKFSIILNEHEIKKYLNFEEVYISKNNLYFDYVDDDIKNNIKNNIKIRNVRKLKFLFSFENKHRTYIINNCNLSRFGDNVKTEGYFFDKNHSFHKILIFIFSYDEKKEKLSMQIKIDFNELLNGKYDLSKTSDFSEILDLINLIENHKIKVSISDNNLNKYEPISENYQKLESEMNQFKKIFMFLKIIQHISIHENLNIFVTKNIIDRNQSIFEYLDILYDSIIFSNPPKKITLNQDYYFYDFDYFCNAYTVDYSKYINYKYMIFGVFNCYSFL